MENLRVGITGGIGSGKSLISRIVRINGFPVYDCDSEAKRIMVRNQSVRKGLTEILGEKAFNSDGTINKTFISEVIFKDIKIRNRVNLVVHEAVKKDFLKFAEKSIGPAFVESAILYTSHIDRICNEIWMVSANERIRVERVVKRSGLSPEEVEKRIISQDKEFLSVDNSKTIHLVNNGDNPILPEIINLLNKLEYRNPIKKEKIC